MNNNGNCKSILWIEDFDTQGAENYGHIDPDALIAGKATADGTDRQPDIDRVFGPYSGRVHLEETALDAVRYIRDNFGSFDTVVLDINLENDKATTGTVSNKKEFCEILADAGVSPLTLDPTDGGTDNDNIDMKVLGFSIFIYLVCLGFPAGRITFNTAYKNGGAVARCRRLFEQACIIMPEFLAKSNDRSGSHPNGNSVESFLDKLYDSPANMYYRVREVVFDAVAEGEAIKQAAGSDVSDENVTCADFPFNITKLMPLRLKDTNSESEIYLSVLKTLCAPFEKKIIFSSNCMLTAKLMRNWYAHEKFKSEDINAEKFLLFFMIIFRAYFDPDCKDAVKNYEDAAFKLLKAGAANDQNLAKNLVNKTIKEFPSYNITISSSYYTIIEALGKTKGNKGNKEDKENNRNSGKPCEYNYLLGNILMLKTFLSVKTDPNNAQTTSIDITCQNNSKYVPCDFFDKIIPCIAEEISRTI